MFFNNKIKQENKALFQENTLLSQKISSLTNANENLERNRLNSNTTIAELKKQIVLLKKGIGGVRAGKSKTVASLKKEIKDLKEELRTTGEHSGVYFEKWGEAEKELCVVKDINQQLKDKVVELNDLVKRNNNSSLIGSLTNKANRLEEKLKKQKEIATNFEKEYKRCVQDSVKERNSRQELKGKELEETKQANLSLSYKIRGLSRELNKMKKNTPSKQLLDAQDKIADQAVLIKKQAKQLEEVSKSLLKEKTLNFRIKEKREESSAIKMAKKIEKISYGKRV